MRMSVLFAVAVMLIASPLFSQNTLDNAGLTAATPSAAAFSLRKLSSSYSGPAIKVRRSSDNAEANVNFDGTGAVTASSSVTYVPGVSLGSSFGTLQTGTITSGVNKTGTITVRAVKTGLISTSNGSLTVNGIATSFTTELSPGDRLYNNSNNVFLGVVASITNNFSLQLTNYATTTLTAISFRTQSAVVTGTGTSFTTELAVGDRLFNSSNTYLGTVSSITNATTLTVNGLDAVAATGVSYKSTSTTITGTGTNFLSMSPGDMLISNNTTIGIIASITNATTLTLTTKAGGAVTTQSFRSTAATIPFSTFYSATSVYVSAWYDQSGNGRDVLQPRFSNQARIVNTGNLHIVNSRTSVEFLNSLNSFLQTSNTASFLNNTLYTVNKVTAEATANPTLQFTVNTTGGSGPGNTILHVGYRSSSIFTLAQYANDFDFNATATTTLEVQTTVKQSISTAEFYKNGASLGVLTSGAPSHLSNVGLLNIGYYTPTATYYSGSVSEVIIFSSALNTTNINLLDDNQLAYYNIATTFWTGNVNTDWTNTGNWSTGVIPTITNPTIVEIPAGRPNYPVISGTSPAHSLLLAAGTSLTINGTLQLAGTINSQGTVTATNGTVQYVGTAAQGIAPNTFASNTVRNLMINNPAGVIMNGNLTASNNLTFTSGKLSIGSSVLTIGGTVTNTVTGGLTGGPASSIVVTGAVSRTLSFDQTTAGTTNSLLNLTINNPGQVTTLGNSLVMNAGGTTTFTAGKLAIGSNTLTLRGAVVNTVNEGLRGSTSSILIVDGTSSPVLSMDQTTPGTTNALNTLTVNASGQTVSLNRPMTISSALNVSAGIFADGGSQVTSTGTINLSSGSTFRLGSATTATTWPAFATNNIAAGSTVEYAAGVLQPVSGTPVYQNLTISATGGTVAGNNLTVNGILNLAAANPSATQGALSTGAFTLNMGASATTVGQGDVTGVVRRTTIVPGVTYTMGNEFSSITFPNTGTLPTQMSMRITIGNTPSWRSGAIRRYYDFIQTGGSGTKAVIKAHYLDSELNGNDETKLVDFSYRFAGSVLTEHGKSNFNTTQNWVELANANVSFFSSSFGDLELTLDETALTVLTWNGSTSTSWVTATNWTPNGGPSTNTVLIIPDAATTPNDPVLPATASNGSVTIQAGGILNADPGAQLTLNNDGLVWSNSGTFNAGTSTITFNNPDASIGGTTNFNNVVINSGSALLMSTGSVMRIGGTMTNNGTWSAGLLHNTVEYNGNNQTILAPNGSTQSYHNLIINGTGTSILPASLNISDSLVINGAISAAATVITMNGDEHDQTISGSVPLNLNNLVINNTFGSVHLLNDLTVSNALTFTAGKLDIGNHILTLSGNVVNNIPNGITGSPVSNIIVNGSVSPVLSFDQSTPGQTNVLNNLTINSSGTNTLGSNLIMAGNLAFTSGKLALNGQTLTLNGDVINGVTGGLRGSSTSNLVIGGGAVSPVLSFDQTTPGTTNLLNNFTINTGGGQSATLGNALVLGGSLNLTRGFINTSAANSLTLGTTASFTGGSDSSFVNGPLSRNTNAVAGYLYPVGKSNTYRPVYINPVSAAAGTYSGEYFLATSPAGSMGAGVIGIATNEYWDIGRASGPDARAYLTYNGNNTWNNGGPTNTSSIFMVELTGGEWVPVYGNTVPYSVGNNAVGIFSRSLNNFAPITFGFSIDAVLPVTLIDFDARKKNQSVELIWKTANEYDFAGFEVERSTDAIYFYSIGEVAARNNASAQIYGLTDNNPYRGANYYRLKMIDIDGHYQYSKVIRIGMDEKQNLAIYPNPVTGGMLFLQMYGQQRGNYQVNLYTVNGQRVMSKALVHDGNDAVRSINLNSNLPSGMYYMEVVDPLRNKTTRNIVISGK